MAAELRVERRDTTLVLTFSNPGFRNALAPEMYAAMLEAFALAERDSTIRTLILTGAAGIFCAGGNLNRLLGNRARPPQVQSDSIALLHELTLAITNSSKPVIAAVEGVAAGAGLSLALACDMIVASRSAKFVMAHVKVGLSPDGGGSWFASRALPRQSAAEMLLEGAAWSSERLHALGAVNQLVADGEALAAAFERANGIAALSPHAVGRIKRLLSSARDVPLETQLEHERLSFVACLHHADGGEAIAAFLEKRKARFA